MFCNIIFFHGIKNLHTFRVQFWKGTYDAFLSIITPENSNIRPIEGLTIQDGLMTNSGLWVDVPAITSDDTELTEIILHYF